MQGVAEAESRRAADAAEQAYREEFNRDVGADEGQLDAEHLRALAAAQQVFNEKAVGEAHILQNHTLPWQQSASLRTLLSNVALTWLWSLHTMIKAGCPVFSNYVIMIL